MFGHHENLSTCGDPSIITQKASEKMLALIKSSSHRSEDQPMGGIIVAESAMRDAHRHRSIRWDVACAEGNNGAVQRRSVTPWFRSTSCSDQKSTYRSNGPYSSSPRSEQYRRIQSINRTFLQAHRRGVAPLASLDSTCAPALSNAFTTSNNPLSQAAWSGFNLEGLMPDVPSSPGAASLRANPVFPATSSSANEVCA